jgi:dephospho-CoA kinase
VNIKILIAGGTCSGKSTLAHRIADHTGYPVTSFGRILRDYARKANLPLTVESLQNLGQSLISQLGYDGFLQWITDHSSGVSWNEPLVLDGVRHVAMYDSLKKAFPVNVLVYCVCDRETQIVRMIDRDEVSREDARRILLHPLEQFVSDLASRAHLFFRPENSLEDFLAQLDALIAKL